MLGLDQTSRSRTAAVTWFERWLRKLLQRLLLSTQLTTTLVSKSHDRKRHRFLSYGRRSHCTACINGKAHKKAGTYKHFPQNQSNPRLLLKAEESWGGVFLASAQYSFQTECLGFPPQQWLARPMCQDKSYGYTRKVSSLLPSTIQDSYRPGLLHSPPHFGFLASQNHDRQVLGRTCPSAKRLSHSRRRRKYWRHIDFWGEAERMTNRKWWVDWGRWERRGEKRARNESSYTCTL